MAADLIELLNGFTIDWFLVEEELDGDKKRCEYPIGSHEDKKPPLGFLLASSHS